MPAPWLSSEARQNLRKTAVFPPRGRVVYAEKSRINAAFADVRPGAERMAAQAAGLFARHPVSPPSRSFEPFPRLEGLGAETASGQRKGHRCLFTSMYFSRARKRPRSKWKNSPTSTRA